MSLILKLHSAVIRPQPESREPLSDTVIRQRDKTCSCYGTRQTLASSSDSVPCPMVPGGSPSQGENVAVYVLGINRPRLPTLFFLSFLKKSCSSVYFCLDGPFNFISFHKFSRQPSAFSLGSSGLISALLVLSTIYLFMKISFGPDIIFCG